MLAWRFRDCPHGSDWLATAEHCLMRIEEASPWRGKSASQKSKGLRSGKSRGSPIR
ncbi:unnamed protein product [Arabidopsis thaliana]|uniref:Uncharacterized protein n=1 Tax=Arabidopsis thaliana TaxID=3702 RepID=A0A654ETS7_ARATH|nr:unnamed protein product [Arabidopsis thaliana]